MPFSLVLSCDTMDVISEIDSVLEESPQSSFLTVKAWERVMEANKAFADLRPEPKVHIDKAAADALYREAIRATKILTENNLLIDKDENPSNCSSKCAYPTFVPFDDLLGRMLAMTVGVLAKIDDMERLGFEPVVFLALPSLRFDKSNAWFLLYLWHQLASLRERTAGVVGHAMIASRVFGKLQERNSKQKLALFVLYVDDMAYTGGQVMNFFSDRSFDKGSDKYYLPIIPFITPEASQGRFADMGVRYDITWPILVLSPASLLEAATNRKYKSRDWHGNLGWTDLGERYRSTDSGSDEAGSTRIAFDRLLSRMSKLVRTLDETIYYENRDVFEALCTFYRVSEITKPSIIFEHKIADNVSISSRLLAFPVIDNAPFPVNTAPRLVNIPGDLEKGSRSFYKGLVWKNAPSNARFQCMACPKKALFFCANCKMMAYCGQDCQVSHWDSLHSATCSSHKK